MMKPEQAARLRTMASVMRVACEAIERGDYEAGARVLNYAGYEAPERDLQLWKTRREIGSSLRELSAAIIELVTVRED